MAFETERQKREAQRWSRLAIQLNGAADSGHFDHITTAMMLRELRDGQVFDLLARELPATVWEVSKLTDVDRHKLAQHWQMLAAAYEPAQFHVSRNGLALLVAYVLHLLDIAHATIPTSRVARARSTACTAYDRLRRSPMKTVMARAPQEIEEAVQFALKEGDPCSEV